MSLVFLIWGMTVFAPTASAAEYGVHVLRPEEFSHAVEMFSSARHDNEPIYVTVPFTRTDLQQLERWQTAFDFAGKNNVVPIVRIATEFNPEQNAWAVPHRKDILDYSRAFNTLQWPQDQRHIILFNEPNHRAEWGGQVDPSSFGQISEFAADWFNTERANYIVLPAAVDLAAPNGATTREGLGFWQQVLAERPELLDKFDGWNSHSYPNPGFSSSPYKTDKMSLRGWQHELAFVKKHTSRELPVYITETGWQADRGLQPRLTAYYHYAAKEIWNQPEVKVVTPFLLQGSPGPFSNFSLLTADGKLSTQGNAFVEAVRTVRQQLLTQKLE